MSDQLAHYKQTFDHTIGAWHKRSHANDFAVFLAAELKINAKGVVTEKDGKVHRVFIPLLSAYWHPVNSESWDSEITSMYRKVRQWATS